MVWLCELAMYAVAALLPALVVTIGLLYTGKRFLLQLGGVHEVTSDATPSVAPVAVASRQRHGLAGGNPRAGAVCMVLLLGTDVLTVAVCAAAVTV